MLIQNNIYYWIETTRIEIKESSQSKFYNNIEDLSIRYFWYQNSDTKRNSWVLLWSHCPINYSLAIYTIPFTSQLCYHSFGILQRVTKSQKVHISNHDGLEKLHNINFVWHRSQGFPEREHNSRNSPFLLLLKQFFRSIIIWLPFIHHINVSRETWFLMIEVMEEVNQPQNWLRNMISSFTYG